MKNKKKAELVKKFLEQPPRQDFPGEEMRKVNNLPLLEKMVQESKKEMDVKLSKWLNSTAEEKSTD